MEEGRPSTTAMIAAMIRAAHLLWDDASTIFQDPLALGLSGVESPGALQATIRTMRAEPYNYAGVLVRQRYAEDELATAVQRGVGQYVILGAGLDSFAYRRPDLATLLRVFEVDHPATQQWKRARIRALAVQLPSNLTFIPLDFERTPWPMGCSMAAIGLSCPRSSRGSGSRTTSQQRRCSPPCGMWPP
jgi:methyltransferase (TIGR00027 family)